MRGFFTVVGAPFIRSSTVLDSASLLAKCQRDDSAIILASVQIVLVFPKHLTVFVGLFSVSPRRPFITNTFQFFVYLVT